MRCLWTQARDPAAHDGGASQDLSGCTEETLTKLISRVGFQLKGTGWYETDFKHKGKPTDKAAGESKDDNPDKAAKGEGDKSESDKSGDAAKDGGEADNKSTKSEAESRELTPDPFP